MCCSAPPKAPNLGPSAKATEKQAELAYKASQDQMDWAKEQWTDQKQLLEQTLGVQTGIMQEQWQNAQADRARYEEVYQGLEDNLVQEFMDYGSDERIRQEMGRAEAAVQQQFDAQRENAQKRLESYGIDPSQTRSQAIDSQARTQMAAQQAAAGNQARYRTEDLGRALRSEALNIGKGYPGQVAQSYAGSLQAGNSAVGNMNATVGAGVGSMGTGQSWGAQGMQGSQMGANIRSQDFGNQLSAYDASGGAMGGMGELLGTGLGAAAAFGMSQGGSVPEDRGIPAPDDIYPTMLKKDEYVVPAEVVRAKGTDFFDKMKEKYAEQGAIPVGG